MSIIFDGQIYESESDMPDLGSLVCTSVNGNLRSYDGHFADRHKLPKYDNMATGSSAFLSDDGNFVLFKYYADTKTWEGNGEVF